MVTKQVLKLDIFLKYTIYIYIYAKILVVIFLLGGGF